MQSTASRAIAGFKATKTTERQRAGGRKAGIVNQTLARKAVVFVQKHQNSTDRELALKYQVSGGWIHKVMRANNLTAYKIQKSANRNDQQAARAKKRARRLYERYLRGKNHCVVMAD